MGVGFRKHAYMKAKFRKCAFMEIVFCISDAGALPTPQASQRESEGQLDKHQHKF
jgi:hypothetical protein